MVKTSEFQLIIRTPHEVILETSVRSARVPAETGQVGLRPRTESTVLAVEAGVIHVSRIAAGSAIESFIGTAGGLLMCDRNTATLLTPLAVVGDSERAIEEQLDDLMHQPGSELEARAALSKLEGHILSELRREQNESVALRLE